MGLLLFSKGALVAALLDRRASGCQRWVWTPLLRSAFANWPRPLQDAPAPGMQSWLTGGPDQRLREEGETGWGVAVNRDSPQRAILSPDARTCRV